MPDAKKQPPVNKHGLKRYIPEDTAREVRKRCGFGCVICGLGLYHYEHFDPVFAKAKKHDPNGITLLCPNHHEKKTKGSISVETVKRFNADPKTLRHGHVGDKFDLFTNNLSVHLGNMIFTKTPILLQILDEPILQLTPGEENEEPFQLSAKLKDRNGEELLTIEKNAWRTPTTAWDCKIEGKRIEIRSASGQIELIIRQEPPTTIVIERLLMFHRGFKIEANIGTTTTFTTPLGGQVSTQNLELENWTIGMLLNRKGDLEVGVDAREGGGIIGLGSIKTNGFN